MHRRTRWTTALFGLLLLAACDGTRTPLISTPSVPVTLLSPPNGRIAFYPFDKAGDNGTVNGATRSFSGGYEGGAYFFDGVDDYIDLPVNVNDSLRPQLTMGAWVKVSSVTPSRPAQILSHGNGGYDRSITLDPRGATDGKHHVSTFTGLGVLAGAVVDTAVWTFVATVYDDSTVTLYVNGETPVTAPADNNPGVDSLRVGGNPAGFNSGEPFHGLIDNVFVFDRALSATEIAAIRAEGACALTGTCVYPRPVAFYPFDTSTGNGTVSGATHSPDHSGSYAFDGVNDFIDLPVSVNPSLRSAVTIGAWMKVASFPADSTKLPAQVLSHDDGGYDRSIALDTRGAVDGQHHVSAFTGTGVLAGSVVDTAAWHFVVAVYTSSSVTLYVNGATPVTAPASSGAGVDYLRVGGNPAGSLSGEPFHGGIDNIFVYDRALSSTEVAQIRAGGVCAIAGLRCTIAQ